GLGGFGHAPTAVIGDQECCHGFLRPVLASDMTGPAAHQANISVSLVRLAMLGRTILLSNRSRGVTRVQLLNTAPDDDVTGLLAALTVRSSVYCLSDLGAPWGFEVDDASTAKFHIVLDGGCWLRLTGADPVWLGHGDLAILPRGERHTVSDSLDSAVRGLDRLIADHPLDADARLNGGGDGARAPLLCGGVSASRPPPPPPPRALPPA